MEINVPRIFQSPTSNRHGLLPTQPMIFPDSQSVIIDRATPKYNRTIEFFARSGCASGRDSERLSDRYNSLVGLCYV